MILLPVYRPGRHLSELVTALLADGIDATRIVVVDDGSGPDAETTLATVRGLGCHVLQHPSNRGKGAALKTGLRFAMASRPGLDVTSADADGQHSVQDIRRVADLTGNGRIILGVRRFAPMPPRSRFGNTVTRTLFRAATGRGVSDTQTGLRAYPAHLLEHLADIDGDRFEYEMNVLLDAATTGQPIEEVTISTTYLDGNAATNFDGFTDSAKVYRPLIRLALTSVLVRRAR
ncbi:glycosyltransferase family 2 protein [Actinoplanes xinjiangensis]|uniref:glycosyltransferase family 2 protein n=1 Tax=Actinoplanes xinjiangensis TaxID=512350 RepID=UPI0034159FEC